MADWVTDILAGSNRVLTKSSTISPYQFININAHSTKLEEEIMSDEPLPMMQGKFVELKKMSRNDMKTEIEAWRNLWGYLDSAVKYYLLKSGTTMAVTMRNYKRHLGVLLSTRWDIRELEMGVFEKEYDQSTGKYYFERKIIKLNPQSFIDLQWIAERIEESTMAQGGEEQLTNQEEQNVPSPEEQSSE